MSFKVMIQFTWVNVKYIIWFLIIIKQLISTLLNCYCSFRVCCRNSNRVSWKSYPNARSIQGVSSLTWAGIPAPRQRTFECWCPKTTSSNVGRLGNQGWWAAEPLTEVTALIFKQNKSRAVHHPWAGWRLASLCTPRRRHVLQPTGS